MTTASITSPGSSSDRKASDEPSPVGVPNIGYASMVESWKLIHDLLGGTEAMREAAQLWLPRESAESTTSYDARLNRSILYNGFRDTLNKLKNRPFTHPITIINLPDEINYLENDVDGNNKPLEIFIKEVLVNLIKYGVAHIFVDHSIVEEVAEGKLITKAEEKERGVRVFLNNISPVNLIGWQSMKSNRITELIQLRFTETVVEASGDYGDIAINYINVYNKENWEVHQQDEENEDKYSLVSEGQSSLGKIPLVTIYANKVGFMTADPPLMDLAWLNLAHWQSYSDQRNILRFSRFGLIFGKGLPEKMVELGTLEIGPTKAFLTDKENADMKYVEHSGKSMEAGQKDIEDIEQKMRVLGNQPLMKDLPNTATAERLDEGRTVSQLQAWIRALERGIMQVLKLACEWRKVTPPDDMKVEIYSDFEAVVLGGSDKKLLLDMRQGTGGPQITRERFLREQKRRGVFSQDMDPEEESKAVESEEVDNLKNSLEGLDEEEIEEED